MPKSCEFMSSFVGARSTPIESAVSSVSPVASLTCTPEAEGPLSQLSDAPPIDTRTASLGMAAERSMLRSGVLAMIVGKSATKIAMSARNTSNLRRTPPARGLERWD